MQVNDPFCCNILLIHISITLHVSDLTSKFRIIVMFLIVNA
jgi:hypothetical protein